MSALTFNNFYICCLKIIFIFCFKIKLKYKFGHYLIIFLFIGRIMLIIKYFVCEKYYTIAKIYINQYLLAGKIIINANKHINKFLKSIDKCWVLLIFFLHRCKIFATAIIKYGIKSLLF